MSSDRSESGFTLVELLVALVVSSIVIGGITSILIITLQSYPQSATKISQSDNPELLTSYFLPDAQSTGSGDGIQLNPTSGVPCAPPADKLRLTWSNFDSSAVTYTVDYCLVGSELIRYYQQGSGPVTQTVVGRNIQSVVPVATIDSVGLDVTTSDLINGAPYKYEVSASRRTPALRIYPVPPINTLNEDNTTLVAGSAEPNALVSLSITDTAGLTVTSSRPYRADGNGNWSATDIKWTVAPWMNLKDGLITFTAQSNGSTATTSTYKDLTPPTATVTLVSPVTVYGPYDVANTLPEFRVTFSEHVTPPPQDIATMANRTGNPGETTKITQEATCPAGTALGSECFDVKILGMDQSDDAGDGAVSVQVPVGAVTDDALNPNMVASNTVTVIWDPFPPTLTLVATTPTTTNTQPLDWLIIASKTLKAGNVNGTDLTFKFPPADGAAFYQGIGIQPAPCPPWTGPGPDLRECFLMQVQVQPDGVAGLVSVTVNANRVFDLWDVPAAAAPSDQIMWSPLTVIENGPTSAATFNGQAGPGTVTLTVCSDAACTLPTMPPQTIPVLGDGTWQWGPNNVVGSHYAQVTQTVATPTGGTAILTATVGPFG